MNEFLAGAMRSRSMRSKGLIDRLTGTAPLSNDRQAQLQQALAEHEHAAKVGDETAMGLADARIERLLSEARAAPAEAEPPRVSWDGGVRPPVGGRRPFRPGLHSPGSRELFAQALAASHAERLERERTS